jgi:brefeldin A-inhibited guanine nucleotide-exchange protein
MTDPTSETAADRTSIMTAVDVSRTVTPEIVDDPGRFESARQKKLTLLEGIRKFNFKPKRVIFILQ